MKQNLIITAQNNGLSLNAYLGVNMVMLTFDIDEHLKNNLAGFAIKCFPPSGEPFYLKNRLTFKGANFKGYHKDTTAEERTWFDSNEAPFQYFRWLHVPSQILSGIYTYEVTAMYYANNNGTTHLNNGSSVKVSLELMNNHPKNFDYGFTRGYLSSQAYVDKFDNKDIRPKGKKTIDFDTKPFKAQYEWLGGKVHKMLFDFLKECASDGAKVKAMIYDCDHPDFIDYLESFGKNLTVILDNATLHHDSKNSKPEDQVAKVLTKSTNKKLVRGHLGRFQHNKVLIKLIDGKPVKVFAGSANFSLRGLYVQANNCFIMNDSRVAEAYNEYFDKLYDLMKKKGSGLTINKDSVTENWFDFKGNDLPVFDLSFSPHADPEVSLGKVTEQLKKADSSVLFSIMQEGGGGEPLEFIKSLPDDKGHLFHYGVVQSIPKGDKDDEKGDYTVIKHGKEGGTVPFSYLNKQVPYPFKKEFSGGMGQVIHDKFIVIDFNSSDPVVVTGSSNLAGGGEKANGDNMLIIYDRAIAIAYAVEAIRLFDHYSFRSSLHGSTKAKPLALDSTGSWVEPYFDVSNRKFNDRKLFTITDKKLHNA